MFQFPEFAPYRLYIQRQVIGLLQPRFRIQKSPDQHLFASSPEHIAGYHVFHRLSMPRHPPHTLSSLTTFIDHRHRCLCPTGKPMGFRKPLSPRAEEDETNVDNGSHRQKGARRLPPTERRSWGSRSCRGGVAEETRSRRASGLAAVALRPGYLEPLITHVFTCQRASYRPLTLRRKGRRVHGLGNFSVQNTDEFAA